MNFRTCALVGLLVAVLVYKAPAPEAPAPPGPAPAPAELATPIAADGFRVLVLEETVERPAWLDNVMGAPEVRGYLNAHCAGGKNGWRWWDDDVGGPNVPPEFRELLAVPRGPVPCAVVSSARRAGALEIPRDSTPASFLKLLSKFGGP